MNAVLTIPTIKLLDPLTTQQIAAGEVIERPASIVKELLENSIDAGATKIEVQLENGGLDLIKIVDDGHGLTPGSLELAIKLHATSKLTTLGDLEHLMSLGFRGEALASINSIANLTIITKTATESIGTSFNNGMQTPIACATGTTMIVRNIFDNIPVRKKFLRSSRSEFLQIEEAWRRLAVSHPKIAFSLTNNGTLIKKLQPCSNKPNDSRFQQLLPKHKAKELLYLHESSDFSGLTVYGWLENLTTVSDVSEHQYVFLNNRFVKDRLIFHAIKEATAEFLERHKVLSFCLYITASPSAFDVNVHPTKHEVRFIKPRIMHDFIYNAVLNALQDNKSITTATLIATPTTFTPAQSKMQAQLQPKMSFNNSVPQQNYHDLMTMMLPEVTDINANVNANANANANVTKNFNIITVLAKRLIIVETIVGYQIIDITKLYQAIFSVLLTRNNDNAVANKLYNKISPVIINLNLAPEIAPENELLITQLNHFGFELDLIAVNKYCLRAIPADLEAYKLTIIWDQFIPLLLAAKLDSSKIAADKLLQVITIDLNLSLLDSWLTTIFNLIPAHRYSNTFSISELSKLLFNT